MIANRDVRSLASPKESPFGKRPVRFGRRSGRPFSLHEAMLRAAERDVFQCRVLLDSLIARRDAIAESVEQERRTIGGGA